MTNTSRSVALIVSLLTLALALPINAQELSGTPEDICAAAEAPEPSTREFEGAEDVLEAGVDYRAIMCTDAGPIYLDLYESVTPITVNNFIFLAQNDYYNNTIFHRVIEDFMVQGGDPTGTGAGGPGYRFEDEFESYLVFDRPGLLAMANAGPGTNGSQFFITTSEPDWLNGAHTIFGDVLQGYENVQNVLLRDPAEAESPATLLETIVIITDPSAVDSTFEEEEVTYSAEDFVEGFATLNDENFLPPNLLAGLEETQTLDTQAVVDAAPADVQDAYSDLLTSNNHDFRVTSTIADSECAGNFFESLTYTVDAFSSADDVAAVIEDETFSSVQEAEGFSTSEDYLERSAQACTDEETIEARVLLQRGRYLVTITGTLPTAVVNNPQAAGQFGTLTQSVGASVYEPFISDIYRGEIR